MDNRGRRHGADLYNEEQVKRVLTGAGLTIENEIDSDFIVFCPFHPNNRTPAGEVDKEHGTFFCFACHHVADLTELVMHISGRTYFEAARFIKSKESNLNVEAIVHKALSEKPDYVPFDELLIKRLNSQALESPRAMNYYRGRLITEESVKNFNLGFSENQDMVTIPVTSPDGMHIGFVGRSVEGKTFKNTPGLPKSKTLFNLSRVKTADKVFVVESSFDAIRLSQCDLPAVATLGSNVSNFQIDLLKKFFNNIYVVADNDDAGGNMAEKLLDKLSSRVSVIHLDKQYKDIGDMSDEGIKNLQYTFDKSIQAMLN